MGIGIALCLSSLRAWGQEQTFAESLFRQGRDAMKAGALDAACDKFAESYRLDPVVGTLLNLGICEERRGRLATAWTRFHQLVDRAPPNDERTQLAMARIAALEPELPRLRIVVEGARVPKSMVAIDGVELREPSFDSPIPIDPGTHVVELKLGTLVLDHEELQIRAGEKLAVRLFAPTEDLVAEVPTKATVPRANRIERISTRPPGAAGRRDLRSAHAELWRTAALVSGAVGATSLVTSVILGSLALAKKADVQRHCSHGSCDPAGLRATDEGRTLIVGADVSLAVAVASGLSCSAFLWKRATVSHGAAAQQLQANAGMSIVVTYSGQLP